VSKLYCTILPVVTSSASIAEIFAKGGNLLLNVGPSPEGKIHLEEKNILKK